ncbi:hypothetical protein R5W24_002897 [Gemmata sp. JC717]|uniref:hypothetical protein n=1 Tax=Gemmata algarum TaxID=2975278 RepID=UPI0021BA4532|nr:hypothetical protein [Gemmata algarum]MDY3553783.1 hypothetical protein [Gemmata algarum]
MTEAEWLAATNPTPMLIFLRAKASNRKLRLFSVACCCRIKQLIYSPWDKVLEAAEQFADGLIRPNELLATRAGADAVHGETMAVEAAAASDHFPSKNADDAAGYASEAVARIVAPGYPQNLIAWQTARMFEELAQCAILRDIFGNPFRPVAVERSWLTSTVLLLTERIYQDRAFDQIPILADALQDAGCGNDDILNHLRSDGPHVKGCWALDLVLGKS